MRVEAAAFPVRCRDLRNVENIKFLIMEMYGKIRCVTHAELVGGGLISASNLKRR